MVRRKRKFGDSHTARFRLFPLVLSWAVIFSSSFLDLVPTISFRPLSEWPERHWEWTIEELELLSVGDCGEGRECAGGLIAAAAAAAAVVMWLPWSASTARCLVTVMGENLRRREERDSWGETPFSTLVQVDWLDSTDGLQRSEVASRFDGSVPSFDFMQGRTDTNDGANRSERTGEMRAGGDGSDFAGPVFFFFLFFLFFFFLFD